MFFIFSFFQIFFGEKGDKYTYVHIYITKTKKKRKKEKRRGGLPYRGGGCERGGRGFCSPFPEEHKILVTRQTGIIIAIKQNAITIRFAQSVYTCNRTCTYKYRYLYNTYNYSYPRIKHCIIIYYSFSHYSLLDFFFFFKYVCTKYLRIYTLDFFF